MALTPNPANLELHSPALGPWFSNNIAPLPLPATDELTIDVTLNNVSWLPPASGLLSFYLVTTPRPKGLAALRGRDGTRAFAEGSFVAVFRLLSWVERRLDALAAGIPTAAQPSTAGVATRPIVRALALELTAPPTDIAGIEALLPGGFEFPAGVTSDEDKASNLGLTWDGAALGNGDLAMSDLLQPGQLFPSSGTTQALLTFNTNTAVRLWAFDHRGRPLDAGAVAAWWNFLATVSFTNLWAAGVAQRTARVANGLVFHLVNAHEGPLAAPMSRLDLDDATGSGVVQTAHNNRGVTVGFTSPPGTDDFPQPLAAVLPDGRYADPAQAWPNGAIAGLARDFARIGVMSVEHQLVGQKRTAPTTPTPEQQRRADDQHRASTGVRPARSMRGALQAGGEATLAALATPFAGAGATTLVASVLDRDAGPVAYALPNIALLPVSAPGLRAQALDGGGTASGSTALDQRILITVNVGSAFVTAWVRVWPLGFDPETGEHTRLDGGAAPVDANGDATMVVALPDGTVSASEPPRLGLDVLIVTGNGERLFPGLRFERPFPAASTARIDVADATAPLLVCATGVQHAGALPNGSVPSGSEVVGLGADPPQLLDRASIPAAAFAAASVVNLLASGDLVQLTQPAWRTQDAEAHASGERPTALGETGATVNEQIRQPFTNGAVWQAGFPLPGMERLEIVCANAAAGGAVVGMMPLLGSLHELPFHHQGHPGCPAAPEVHGNGVLATGSAVVPFAEYVRDRTIGSTIDLAEAAQAPIVDPGVPTANSLWIAGLRTEAAGVASELAYDLLSTGLGDPYPFGGTWDDITNFLFSVLGALPAGTPVGPALVSARRAIDRRILTASYGAREGATAMVAAIARAEDFIYIETPAFDDVAFGHPGDEVDLWQALIDRMDENPSLHVAICVPFRLLPGAPAELQRVRDQLIASALTNMSSDSRAERFVAFSPAAGPARALRIAGTTLVVDDAIAVVGTTHLWRRGLSFDSSYAAAVLDEQLLRGRSQEVATFRMAAMAAQLGILAAELPLDPSDTIRAIGDLVARGGLDRLAPERVRPPDPTLTTVEDTAPSEITDSDIWNPDGSFPDLDPFGWLLGLRTAVYDNVFNPPP
ncbi:MAG: hypothetical protein AAF495_28495 [Pseudomonadota bacterium]